MKTKYLLVGLFSIFLLASCSENKREENTTVPPAEAPPPPPPAPAPETIRVEKTKPDGTTIKVDENGVKYENQEGGKKSKVNISKDSSSIEITKPK